MWKSNPLLRAVNHAIADRAGSQRQGRICPCGMVAKDGAAEMGRCAGSPCLEPGGIVKNADAKGGDYGRQRQ